MLFAKRLISDYFLYMKSFIVVIILSLAFCVFSFDGKRQGDDNQGDDNQGDDNPAYIDSLINEGFLYAHRDSDGSIIDSSKFIIGEIELDIPLKPDTGFIGEQAMRRKLDRLWRVIKKRCLLPLIFIVLLKVFRIFYLIMAFLLLLLRLQGLLILETADLWF